MCTNILKDNSEDRLSARNADRRFPQIYRFHRQRPLIARVNMSWIEYQESLRGPFVHGKCDPHDIRRKPEFFHGKNAHNFSRLYQKWPITLLVLRIDDLPVFENRSDPQVITGWLNRTNDSISNKLSFFDCF